MNAVWKFAIEGGYVEVPKGARFLHFGLQGDTLCGWAVVNTDDDHEKETVFVHIVGTGHEIGFSGADYIDTFFDGLLVFHVFVSVPTDEDTGSSSASRAIGVIRTELATGGWVYLQDREEGNTHPTVKPTELMRYLCRLVTPPDGPRPLYGLGVNGQGGTARGLPIRRDRPS